MATFELTTVAFILRISNFVERAAKSFHARSRVYFSRSRVYLFRSRVYLFPSRVYFPIRVYLYFACVNSIPQPDKLKQVSFIRVQTLVWV